MDINDLIDKIYRLNDVKDGFWKDYLDEIRNDFKVTWHRSCGYDLRPLHIINTIGRSKTRALRKISKELKNTDVIFSDAADYYTDYYDIFLDLSNNKQVHIFYGYGLNNKKANRYFEYPNNLSDVRPFKLFTSEERNELKCLRFKNSWGDEVAPIINTEREFDGFAMKISGYDFSESYITLIYLCLDDRITKKILFDYNIEITCLFESRTGGKAGGLPFGWLFYDLEEFKNIKYIFTDKCFYNVQEKKYKLIEDSGYEMISDEYFVIDYNHHKFPPESDSFDDNEIPVSRGTFYLAIKNQNYF